MKPEFKSRLFICFILCLSNILSVYCGNNWNYNKGGADWLESCKKGDQSPIDINQPFIYKNFSLNFEYTNMMTDYIFFNDGNNVILEGDFGFMNYNNITYFSSQIQFFSPSLHTISGRRLPLELQIWHRGSDGSKLAISILFKYSNKGYSLFLANVGFDDTNLENQEPFKPVSVKSKIDLSKYVTNKKDFFIYYGKESAPPCECNTIYLILTDVMKISKKQFDNFPRFIKNHNRIIQQRNDRKIYTTFKMEEVLEKQKRIKEKIEQIKRDNENEEKMKKAQLKTLEKLNDTQKLNEIDRQMNKTLAKYNKTRINNTNKISIKNSTEKQESCADKSIIPFDEVAQQAEAYESYIKADEPKLIGEDVTDKNQTLLLDRELPESDAEKQRKKLETQYQLWKELHSQTTKDGTLKPKAFLQMKVLEKILLKSEYEPFMRERKLQNEDNRFLSFIQIQNKKFLSTNQAEFEDIKIIGSGISKEAEKVGLAVENAPDDEMDKIIDNFIKEVDNNSKYLEMAKNELKENDKPMEPTNGSVSNNIKNLISKDIENEKPMEPVDGSLSHNIKNMISKEKENNFDAKVNLQSKIKVGGNSFNDMKITGTMTIPLRSISKQMKIEEAKKAKINRENKAGIPMELISNSSNTQALIKADINISNMNQPAQDNSLSIKAPVDSTIPLTIPAAHLVKKDIEIKGPKELEPRINSIEENTKDDQIDLAKNIIDDKIAKYKKLQNVFKKTITDKDIVEQNDTPNKQKNFENLENNNLPIEDKSVVEEQNNKKLSDNLDDGTDLSKKLIENKIGEYEKLKQTFVKSNEYTHENKNKQEKDKNQEVNKENDEKSEKLLERNDIEEKYNNNENYLAEEINKKEEILHNVNQYQKMKSIADIITKSLNVKNDKLNNTIYNLNSDEANETENSKEVEDNSNTVYDDDEEEEIDESESNAKLNSDSKCDKVEKEEKDELAHTSEVFDTNLDYDKRIFNIIKIVISNLIPEFTQLDKINSKLYREEINNGLLTTQGYVRITDKNFGLLIRGTLNTDIDENLSFDHKISKLSNLFSKILISQNKLINKLKNYYDVTDVDEEDIKNIINKIMVKDDSNNYELKKDVNLNKLKVLIIKTLEKLPIILMRKKNEDNVDIPQGYDLNDEGKRNESKNDIDEDLFITKDNAKRLRGSQKVFGPKKLEKDENAIKPTPGQGRKASTADGIEEKVELFDTTNWPSPCKNGLQSPININKPYLPEEFGFKINLKAPKGKIQLINDGYKLILIGSSFGDITHGSHRFDAKQIEIHHPSEHTFGDDEVRSPIELQIIFQDMFGNTAAIAILFKIDTQESKFLRALGFGVDNPLFALKLRNSEIIDLNEEKVSNQLDLGPLINDVNHYVTYDGSLTTPPCTQNVKWFILLKKIGITQEQLDYFPILFGKETNIRGLQERKDRPLRII